VGAVVPDTRVLVVDDHRVVAETLRMAIDLEDAMACVGITGSVDEALALVAQTRPDVVLMDVRLPGMDGIEGTRRIKAEHPPVRVLILSAYTGVEVVSRAASAGASGVLAKEGALADIVSAIRTATEGSVLVDSLALGEGTAEARDLVEQERGLTAREQEVLGLMGEGCNPKTIARHLGISVETVRGHLKAILAKLDAHTQLEAVMTAQREGLLDRLD
jgi:DNA-binding NarL/FixJ family response regulator